MTTEAYLVQLRTIDLEIAMCDSEAQSWRDLATKMHHEPSEVRVDTSPSPDKMENMVVKAADCAIQAERERAVLLYTKSTIEKQIKGIENKDMRFMLWGYYHDSKTVETLSREIHVTDRQGWRIKDKAMRLFERIFGKTYL